MTEKQKERILKLRKAGMGYRKIATLIGSNRDSVRNYCKSQGVNGYGKQDGTRKKQSESGFCKVCGVELIQPPTGRRRLYCSTECRRIWQSGITRIYIHTCEYCHGEFESAASKQKFCSRECYIRDRFWREEDAGNIVERILHTDEQVLVPKWFKDRIK